MAHQSPIGNPFMLMMHPEIVLAAIENSERLGKLDRRLCRPLDRTVGAAPASAEVQGLVDDDADPGDDEG